MRYDIGQQEAQVISNVGRDQYNAHVQQVIQQRDSFMREIAGTKTKARWLVWLGLLLFVVGFAMFAAADLNFLKQISSDVQSNSTAAAVRSVRPPHPRHPVRAAGLGHSSDRRADARHRDRAAHRGHLAAQAGRA